MSALHQFVQNCIEQTWMELLKSTIWFLQFRFHYSSFFKNTDKWYVASVFTKVSRSCKFWRCFIWKKSLWCFEYKISVKTEMHNGKCLGVTQEKNKRLWHWMVVWYQRNEMHLQSTDLSNKVRSLQSSYKINKWWLCTNFQVTRCVGMSQA